MPIDHSGKHIVPDIEFPPLVQKRFLNILLQNEGLRCAIIMASSSLNDRFYLFESEANDDAVASIGELPWLTYPDIIVALLFALFLSLVESLQEVGVLIVVYSFLYVEGKWQVVEHLLVR